MFDVEIYRQINGEEEENDQRLINRDDLTNSINAVDKNDRAPSNAGRIFKDGNEQSALERFKGSFTLDDYGNKKETS